VHSGLGALHALLRIVLALDRLALRALPKR
jgi:hypothetical protein